MPDCPKCHQAVETQALECPYCRTPLKAHGHPGMTLYQATGKEPLCLTCLYHEDDTCTFPKRPFAMDCTLYCDRTRPSTPTKPGYSPGFQIQVWFKRNLTWIILAALVLLSLLIALLQ
ncbi:MAG: zinc ribbon domain-containing protein [Leptodesmis sp.]|jgi:hypothetical protein|uniref:zinc ribbon domain-containing protein n=1 Tax=Leptodesmis sp. TaxID=3100501 RepID=UPI003D0FA2FC